MLRMTWRNLFARKVRLALSAFAIVLGVAFVAGSFIFTDAMGDAFDGIIEGSTADVEVAYKGANDFDSQQDARTIAGLGRAPARRSCPRSARCTRSIQLQSVFVIGRDGKVVGGNGPPGLAFNYTGATIAHRQADHHPDQRRVPAAAPARWRSTSTPPARPGTASATPSRWSPGRPADPEGEGHRAGRVRLRRPQRRDADALRPARACSSSSSAAGTSTPRSRSTPRPACRQAAAARRRPEGAAAPAWSPAPATRCVKKNKASLDEILGFLNTFLLVFAGGLAGGRHLPDHQHLLDPGRAAQPRARAAAGARRLAPPGQPSRCSSRRSSVGLFGSTRRARRGLPARARAAAAVRRVRLRPEPGRPSRSTCARSSRRTPSGVRGHDGRGVPARPAAPPRSRRSRRCATTSRCPRRRCAAGCSVGFGLIVVGVVGMVVGFDRERQPRPQPDRRRHARDPGRRLAAEPVGRPAADPAVRDRLPPRVRHRRHAGRAELPAQPAPYGGHGQRADDRADPGGADVDPRPVRDGQHRRRGQAHADVAVRGVQRRRHAVLDRASRARSARSTGCAASRSSAPPAPRSRATARFVGAVDAAVARPRARAARRAGLDARAAARHDRGQRAVRRSAAASSSATPCP